MNDCFHKVLGCTCRKERDSLAAEIGLLRIEIKNLRGRVKDLRDQILSTQADLDEEEHQDDVR